MLARIDISTAAHFFEKELGTPGFQHAPAVAARLVGRGKD